MRTTVTRAWHVLFLIPLTLTGLGVIGFVTVKLTWPPQSITRAEMEVLDPVVKPGNPVRFTAHVCKAVEAASELHFAMVNEATGDYIDAGMQYGNNRAGCFDVIQHFHVPSDTPRGRYDVHVVGRIPVNALRTDTYRMPMGEVEVR